MNLKYDWKIIGHEKVLSKLESSIENDNLASATLLVGPSEIGKARVAKTLAKILEIGPDYSQDHPIARQIEQNLFSDLITVDQLWQKDRLESFEIIGKTSNFDQSHRVSKKMRSDTISIDDVRSFSERIFEKPQARWKICLIKNVHRMNNESANAFLKLLEEPPNRTIFLLTATHEKLLPETVISRTRTIQMNLVPLGTLRSYLRKIDRQLSTEKTEELLTLSQGRPARLTRFLEDPDFLLAERSFFHTISKLLTEKSPPEKLRFAEKISSEEDLGEFFDRLLHFLRSLLVEKINAETLPLQAKITLEQIVAMIEKTNNAKTSISKNVNKRLTLESLFLSLV